MVKKDFMYRGKTWEEIEKLNMIEFAQLLPSRQRRSIKRGLPEQQKILLKKIKKKNIIETHLRDMIIFPEMVGKRIKIHNGKTFTEVMIEKDMIGHYLGEFALTRGRVQHSAPGIGATRSSAALSVR